METTMLLMLSTLTGDEDSRSSASFGGRRAAVDAVFGRQQTRHDVRAITTERRRLETFLCTSHSVVVPLTPDPRDRQQVTAQVCLAIPTYTHFATLDAVAYSWRGGSDGATAPTLGLTVNFWIIFALFL